MARLPPARIHGPRAQAALRRSRRRARPRRAARAPAAAAAPLARRACARAPAGRPRAPRACGSRADLFPVTREPVLEQQRGRARVLRRPAAGLLGDRGREALVVELDRDRPERLSQACRRTRASRASARCPRRRGRAAARRRPAASRSRTSAASARSPFASPAVRRPPIGRRERAGRVAERARRSARCRSPARARASARERCLDRRARGGDRLGQLVGVPAAGPRHRVAAAPAAAATSAATFTIAPAFTPRSTSAGATVATRWTLPSATAPSTIAASPSLPLTRSARSGSALGSLDARRRQPAREAPSRSVGGGQQRVDVDGSRSTLRPSSQPSPAPSRAPAAPTTAAAPARAPPAARSAASRSASSCARSSATAAGPVSASMRRTFAALEVSLTIRNSADLGRRAHVRAAAQLAREGAVADLDHPHDVAVLLAEQRHRAERSRLVERRRDRAHGVVLEDPAR